MGLRAASVPAISRCVNKSLAPRQKLQSLDWTVLHSVRWISVSCCCWAQGFYASRCSLFDGSICFVLWNTWIPFLAEKLEYEYCREVNSLIQCTWQEELWPWDRMAVPPEEGVYSLSKWWKRGPTERAIELICLSGVLQNFTLSSSEEHQAMPAHRLPDKSKACSHVVIAYHSQQIITLILSWGKCLGTIHHHLTWLLPDIPVPACSW